MVIRINFNKSTQIRLFSFLYYLCRLFKHHLHLSCVYLPVVRLLYMINNFLPCVFKSYIIATVRTNNDPFIVIYFIICYKIKDLILTLLFVRGESYWPVLTLLLHTYFLFKRHTFKKYFIYS